MNRHQRKSVVERAGGRCEYCKTHQDDDPFYTFPIDHIISRQHRGSSELDNLCLSCFRCNSFKGPNLSSIDPKTGTIVTLFHPRHENWSQHFRWNDAVLIGLTPTGRATVELLNINHSDHVALREALIEEGHFPPKEI